MKYSTFISYRRNNNNVKNADLIKSALEANGIDKKRIFIDRHHDKAGDFDKRLYHGISNSNTFILLVTKGCFEWKESEDWLLYEIRTALDQDLSYLCCLTVLTVLDQIWLLS